MVVIDDDPLVLDSMGGLLRSWGCIAVTAAGAVEAMAHLPEQDQPPDLIIADYNLADGVTGVVAIEALRAKFGTEVPAFLGELVRWYAGVDERNPTRLLGLLSACGEWQH